MNVPPLAAVPRRHRFSDVSHPSSVTFTPDTGKTAAAVRVLYIDDHRIVRQGVSAILNETEHVRVVASTATVEEALAVLPVVRPDVVLMELRLRTISGLHAIRAIRRRDRHARVIVLTAREGVAHFRAARDAGATACLSKDVALDCLVDAIRRVHDDLPVPHESEGRDAGCRLTPRELDVLRQLSEWKTNNEIAAALHISHHTVEVHFRKIFSKLDVRNRSAALRAAVRREIVRL